MASQDDNRKGTKNRKDNPDNVNGGSGSKSKKKRAGVSNVKKGGDSSPRVVTRQADGTNSSDANAAGTDGSSDVKGKKIKEGEGSGTDNRVSASEMNVDHVFQVGDIVWSKVKNKNHPWCPGQIYDTTDATDDIAKHRRKEGSFLVIDFGFGGSSWCWPSEMVPFVENFRKMSTDVSSRSVHEGIQLAVDEIGRSVESEMLCKCIPLEKRENLARPKAPKNQGIKEGVLVPEVDTTRLSVPKYECSKILAEVVKFSKNVAAGSLFELVVLRSNLSAFYRFYGYKFSEYREPSRIEGLEDENSNETKVPDDFTFPIKVPIGDPKDDSPTSLSKANSVKSPDDKTDHKRRRKSVADIMGENSNVRITRATAKEGKEGKTSASSSKGKRGRKRRFELSENSESKSTRSRKRKKIAIAVSENAEQSASDEHQMIAQLKELEETSAAETTSLHVENYNKLSFSASDVNMPVHELLSEMQSAALVGGRLYLSKRGYFDTLWSFLNALRSSTYLLGVNYRAYQKFKKARKNKSVVKLGQNQENEEKSKSAENKTSKEGKLTLIFSAGYPLPSKEEIVSLFSEFGTLNLGKTRLLSNVDTVEIVYMKYSDAEAALNSRIREEHFGAENVYFMMDSCSPPEQVPQKSESSSSQQTDGCILDVCVMILKLEMMKTNLENYHLKFSAEEKLELKDAMRNLMKSVEAVSERVIRMFANVE